MSSFNAEAQPFVPGQPSGKDRARGGGNRGRGRGGGRRGGGGNTNGGRQVRGSQNQNRNRRPSDSHHDGNNREVQSILAEHELFSNSTRNKRGEVDISHLLDISRPSYGHQRSVGPPASARRRRPSKSHYSNNKYSDPAAEKEAYVNISCKFVLDPRGQYKNLLNDPDEHVPLDQVIRIIALPSSCPICLEEVPEAPRMLGCGHILCYPCFFRFLNSENITKSGDSKPKKHKECPFCFDRINPDRIKPVSFAPINELFDTPREDTDVVLRLMFRPMGSLIAVPRDTDHLTPEIFDDLPSTDMPDISRYSRLIKGSSKYMVEEYTKEINQLELSKKENQALFDDNGKWYDQAISTIKETVKVVSPSDESRDNSVNNGFVQDHQSAIHPEVIPPWSQGDEDDKNDDIQARGVEEQVKNLTVSTPVDANTSLSIKNLPDQHSDTTAYFFYQAGFDNVTKYFLAPLDAKIIRSAYGAYCALPPTLLLHVENILYGTTINQEVRKRIKYLNHLPVHTPIAFLECEWRGVLSEESLKPFAKDLQSRRKRKKDKARKEERDRQRYQREEEEHLQAELMTEEYYSPYSAAAAAAAQASQAAHPSGSAKDSRRSEELIPVTAEKKDSSKDDNGVSFAAIASGEAQSGRDLEELNELLSSAPRKGKGKGKKKLVLMSNGRGR